MEEYYFANKALEWAQAVIFQGERTIETAQNNMMIFNDMYGDDFSLSLASKFRQESERNRFRIFMEEHFFIIALAKSIDFFKKFNHFDAIRNDIYNNWGKTTIDDIRNMREHDDEFIVGKGKTRPQNFLHEYQSRRYISDATSTIMDFSKREYLLGGRLNIFEVVDFYNNKFKNINAIYEKLIKEIKNNEMNQF
ncbi:hypothetical protein [Lacrimispora aerotolerans]|uniref:hypothetical protein n=1 Tax=Lacrimispora aerotolerans TaxID=36832 RepID=UPI000479CB8E|nr:hypothetical protein [Lacrimispora aerotolerans]